MEHSDFIKEQEIQIQWFFYKQTKDQFKTSIKWDISIGVTDKKITAFRFEQV